MTVLRAAGLLLLTALLPACSGPENAIESAHAIFLARPDCPYFVTNRTAANFAVLAPRDGFAPRQGDLLVGNLRDGALPLDVVPFDAEAITRTASFEVVGRDLRLAEAQALYYDRCPIPPDSTPSSGLPLAPEDVPVTVPSDTTGTPR